MAKTRAIVNASKARAVAHDSGCNLGAKGLVSLNNGVTKLVQQSCLGLKAGKADKKVLKGF